MTNPIIDTMVHLSQITNTITPLGIFFNYACYCIEHVTIITLTNKHIHAIMSYCSPPLFIINLYPVNQSIVILVPIQWVNAHNCSLTSMVPSTGCHGNRCHGNPLIYNTIVSKDSHIQSLLFYCDSQWLPWQRLLPWPNYVYSIVRQAHDSTIATLPWQPLWLPQLPFRLPWQRGKYRNSLRGHAIWKYLWLLTSSSYIPCYLH